MKAFIFILTCLLALPSISLAEILILPTSQEIFVETIKPEVQTPLNTQSSKGAPLPPLAPLDPLIKLKDIISRQYDGTKNNPNNPLWGSTGQSQPRYCGVSYKDGLSQMLTDADRPNARVISNAVGNLNNLKLSIPNWNMLFPIWGQFLDHDIFAQKTASTESVPINVPKGDPNFDPKGTGTVQLPFTRSGFDPTQTVRTQVNLNTAWIDAGQIYGSSKSVADSLRSFQQGKLLMSDGNLLSKGDDGFFRAGDSRVNQNIGLIVLHTIFYREHNRVCDVVLSKNSTLTDEQVYQIARKYVIALIQHITYDEYLGALLGPSFYPSLVGQYQYQPSQSPNIFTQFSSAFRLGHVTINTPFNLMDNAGTTLSSVGLDKMFFNPSLVTSSSFSQILNGMIRTNSKQRSLQMINDLRNYLITTETGSMKMDLFSINVQRGRDHGLCSYKQARIKWGLEDDTFANLFGPTPQKANALERLYGSTDNVDLWVGIIGQKTIQGSDLGSLGGNIVSVQFRKIRNSDSQWYENIFPPALKNEIRATRFADVIKRNSDIVSITSPKTFVKFS